MADKLNIPGFKHYELDSIYQAKLAAGEVDAKDLSFVKETGKLYTQGGEYGGGGPKWSYLKGYGAGTIVYHDGTKLKKVSPDKWDASLGTPVGVIVIPRGFAPDGKERMVGLYYITSDGSIGTSQSTAKWFNTNNSTYTDTPLTNYDVVPITNNNDDSVVYESEDGYFPSNAITGVQAFTDPQAQYLSGKSPLSLSPYKGDQANPSYYAGSNNAAGDFDGLGNTKTLVNLGSQYVAANAAWNYNDGVSDKQWYLPSLGELGYLMARLRNINDSLSLLGGHTMPISTSSWKSIWSSTEKKTTLVYRLYVNAGKINSDSTKGVASGVRPFAIID